MTSYVRSRDGNEVSAEEALEPSGTIREGYGIRRGVLMMDNKPGSTSVSVQDAIANIHPEFKARFQYAIADLTSDEPFRIEEGIRHAGSLVYRMKSTNDQNVGTARYFADADHASNSRAADYLEGCIAAAREKLREIRGESVPRHHYDGIPDGLSASERAHARMCIDIRNAWRR